MNRQYSKNDYFELLQRIVNHMKATGEWGMFFPPRLSPHWYQESLIDAWFDPISLSTAKERGYRVKEAATPVQNDGAVSAETLPNSIATDSREFLGKRYLCTRTGQVFGFEPHEIRFYQRNLIPFPTVHWRQRLLDLKQTAGLIPAV